MKRFSCGDIVPGCAATWAASGDEEILTAVARRAAEVHGLTDLPIELVDAVRARITVSV